MPTPEADLVDFLEEQVALDLEQARNLFAGPVRAVQSEVPPTAVFVLLTGGVAPVPYLNDEEDFRRFSVQVRVRHESRADGMEQVEALAATLQRAEVEGYVFCLLRGEPAYLGQDDEARFEWSLNVELGYKG